MASAAIKRFTEPDDTREIPGGRIDTVTSPAGAISVGVLQPGWRWSKDIKPVVGTEWCEFEHFEYVIGPARHPHARRPGVHGRAGRGLLHRARP